MIGKWGRGTAPPFHVYCRSTTVPAFDDEFDLIGERAARGEDGNTYYVPSTMTYKVVLRLALATDENGLKNSIMTFWRIRDRNLKKLIGKNKLLYKKG